jgi:carbamoyl-phosphate synthase small subunit
MKNTQAKLLLEDGTLFHGISQGAIGTVTGEICFNTGMSGYQEVFTDPSYYGQLVICTNVHIGNYGVNLGETESDSVKINGLICKTFSETHSRQRDADKLKTYFENDNIVAISGVDTRKLVKHIRENGAMNAIISSEELSEEEMKRKLNLLPSMKGRELASKVSTSSPYNLGESNAKYRVAVVDLGVKTNILRNLIKRECYVCVFPYNTDAHEILNWNPDGILVSNGPGDPEPLEEVKATISELLASDLPMFGICLGHQVIALSQGLKTYKMHNGHRGINHPVKNLTSGKCEITSQNHGFAVELESAHQNNDIEITHMHLNDETVAGIRIKNKSAFSVQFHPEASPGPKDSEYLFDDFVQSMRLTDRKQSEG